MRFRKAVKKDADELAELHAEYIHWGFLTSLGTVVLRTVYASLAEYPEGAVMIAEENGKIAGFVSGVSGLKNYYSFFFRKHFFKVFPQVIKRPMVLCKALETLRYPFKSRGKDPGACLPDNELLAIVVRRGYQGKGVARGLFDSIGKWFDAKGEGTFKTTVGDNNSQSITFFKKMGCRIVGEEEIHKGEVSRVFLCD
jgi:GNAT superfamily N-acetyltransferase